MVCGFAFDPQVGESTMNFGRLTVLKARMGQELHAADAYKSGGGKDPYGKLKAALRAEIDPDAWGTLYSAVNRASPAPKSGHVAVKVINHYGDEAMKVFRVS